jgi:NAD(P)-dependent dehydrogenase (short-subunit alcohol dehydrogenase family)
MKLANQVALITGGSRGLGLAIARALTAEGAAVACLARAGDELERAVTELSAGGGKAVGVHADVTRDADVEAAVRTTIDRFGRLDIVVINAGTWLGGSVMETTEKTWDLLLDLNLKGAFLTLKHALPPLIQRGQGTVVGISSLGGWVGQANASAYAASKWGLRGLLESVALEVKPHRIRVSIVSPHNINSAGAAIDPDSDERLRKLEPADIAAMVAMICAAPPHVSVGNLNIWPIGAGIVSKG